MSAVEICKRYAEMSSKREAADRAAGNEEGAAFESGSTITAMNLADLIERTAPPARTYAEGVAIKLLQQWETACEQHNALLDSGEEVTGAKVKRSGSKCTNLYSQLTTASVAAIRLLSQGEEA